MAILIVDPDELARNAFRRLARGLGFSPVLEAADGERALELARRERSRLKYLLSAWELVRGDSGVSHSAANGLWLLEQIEADASFSFLPFVLLTSGDEVGMSLRSLRREYPRCDAILPKPFGRNLLRRALQTALSSRVRRRTALGYVGSDATFFAQLQEALKHQGLPARWSRCDWVNPVAKPEGPAPGSAERRAYRVSRRSSIGTCPGRNTLAAFGFPCDTGAILLDVEMGERREMARGWLSSLQKTVAGRQVSVACLSRRADLIGALRSHCHLFLDRPKHPAKLDELLNRLSQRADSAWQRERLAFERCGVPSANRGGPRRIFPGAFQLSPARRLLRVDPNSGEGHCALAEEQESRGDSARAILHYEKSLATNPCYPRPYIRLFQIFSRSGQSTRCAQLAETAARFCPDHPELRMLVAGVWRQLENLPSPHPVELSDTPS